MASLYRATKGTVHSIYIGSSVCDIHLQGTPTPCYSYRFTSHALLTVRGSASVNAISPSKSATTLIVPINVIIPCKLTYREDENLHSRLSRIRGVSSQIEGAPIIPSTLTGTDLRRIVPLDDFTYAETIQEVNEEDYGRYLAEALPADSTAVPCFIFNPCKSSFYLGDGLLVETLPDQ